MSERRQWWLSYVYEDSLIAFDTKEEALATAWSSDEKNVIHVIDLQPGECVLSVEDVDKICKAPDVPGWIKEMLGCERSHSASDEGGLIEAIKSLIEEYACDCDFTVSEDGDCDVICPRCIAIEKLDMLAKRESPQVPALTESWWVWKLKQTANNLARQLEREIKVVKHAGYNPWISELVLRGARGRLAELDRLSLTTESEIEIARKYLEKMKATLLERGGDKKPDDFNTLDALLNEFDAITRYEELKEALELITKTRDGFEAAEIAKEALKAHP